MKKNKDHQCSPKIATLIITRESLMLGRRKSLAITLLVVSICVMLFILMEISEHSEVYFTETRSAIITYNTQNVPLPLASPQSSTTRNKVCSSGTVMFENYCILSPYTNELKSTSSVGPVTLCTQGTVEFLQHVTVLCKRWNAPMSVAVYSPKEDYLDARFTVHLLRKCDLCVRNWVNWHFFIENQEIPEIRNIQFNRDCNSLTQEKREKRKSNGLYPINVGRNVARHFAHTPYVFSTDIELYPSLNIPAKFERMLQQSNVVSSHKNEVWVLPVFEVQSNFKTPLSKHHLKNMFFKKDAISFHQYRCDICHKIPNLTQWMKVDIEERNTELENSLEPLRVFSTVKRDKRYKLNVWEPFFIGTTSDPEFDIRLSWEGKQNKMQMAYEMCMRNYEFHILENAFLVHAPGINIYNAQKEKFRAKYTFVNNRIMASIKKDLIRKYNTTNGC